MSAAARIRPIALVVTLTLVSLAAGFWIGRSTGESDATLAGAAVDIGFLQDMNDHHGQAVLMSSHVLRHGENDQIRLLAANILANQTDERGQMAALLADRGAGAGAPDRMAMAWMGNPQPLDDMLGYIRGEDLAEMLNLEGSPLDQRFLELMLCHHVGGVVMAEMAAQIGSDPIVVELAERMAVTQQREVTDIELMLVTSAAELGCDMGGMTASPGS